VTALIPLAGPLHEQPLNLDHEDALAQLGAALQRIPRGAWDERTATCLSRYEPSFVATLASWLRRSYESGVADGRRDKLEEHPVIEKLTARVAELERLVEQMRDWSA
jgi:hypothetical protein